MARPWYPWYPGDYARDTAHLTFVEDAAYRRLLDHYYSTGTLPANAEILLRVCRAISPAEQAAVAKVAEEFFREVDGVLVQDRAAAEITKSRYLSGIRSDAGRRGASKTNGKEVGKAPATDTANGSANTPAIADTTTTTSSKPSCAVAPHGRVSKDEPEGFAECWSAYPKREGGNSRTEALKAYRARIRAGVLPADLLDGVQRYATFIRATGKEGSAYVRQAATFFGPGEHWREPWELPAGSAPPPADGDWRANPIFAGAI